MKRWILALVAVAFFVGTPAVVLAGGGGSCGSAAKSGSSSQQMSGSACGHMTRTGAVQATSACCSQKATTTASRGQSAGAGCSQMMSASACGGAMGASAMACGSMHTAGMQCGAMGAGSMNCGAMGAGMGDAGCCEGRAVHVSHDPSNIWFRGMAPRSSVAAWACNKDGHGSAMAMGNGGQACSGHAMMHASGMACGAGSKCGAGMKATRTSYVFRTGSGSGMNGCATGWMAGAGKSGGTGCPHAIRTTAWKSGCSANTVTTKGGCCAGRGTKA